MSSIETGSGFLTTKRTLASLVCVWLSLLDIGFAKAEDSGSARQWLQKMQVAAVQQDYKGVFVFSRGGTSSSMNVIHRYHNGEEQERLTQLDGEQGEVIRRGSEVLCVLPNNRVVQVAQSKLNNKIASALASFKPDHRYYIIEMAGHDRVIDRTSVKVSVTAQDKHRYSYVLWIDQQTGLLLKSVLQNSKGEELEHFQYTRIEFPEVITDKEFQVGNEDALLSHELIPPAKKDSRWPSDMMWMVTWVPPGFEQLSGAVDPGDNVMVYSDGLAGYSVFIEMSENNMLPKGASKVGATVAYAQKLKFGEHQYNVTVVGEIPAITAMMVAESVSPKLP